MQLNENVILLTGGTSGIGKALLERFLEGQNKLIVTSRSTKNLEQLQNEHPRVNAIQCDLSDPESVQNLIDRVHFEYKDLNILVNNAGIQYNDQWLSGDEKIPQHIEKEVRVNLISPLQLTYGLLPILENKAESAIINVSSGLAFVPKQSAPVYCGTKAGLHISTKSLRYQLENTSIKVFEIIPPIVDTPMTTGRGQGKITPQQLVSEFMTSFAKNRYEVSIGKTKWLRLIQRITPKVADGILKDA